MAESVILNNYSDDSQIKEYINSKLMPAVFKGIPRNQLNLGLPSIISEYTSQALENQAFTNAFYFNENFITKAVLPDSIYAEAAIFNLGYSYATPSACNILLELRIDDIYKNAVLNPETGLYEFILDKNTIINLVDNGNTYSLDYDILIQYRNVQTSASTANIPAWNCQYINMDELNVIATNKDRYITYRVTSKWLCLFIQVNEYVRTKYTVINNTTYGIAPADKVISCNDHICGFDIKYIDASGNGRWIPHDHILPIHSEVTDQDPYVHYIMDNPQTIRFMFQLDGLKYFKPETNSSYEIYIYTCHGEAANFNAWNNEESQPQVIACSNRYPNNANILKACFVLAGGSMGGTNIGTVETTRRETIEAYNTVNALSTDHDINEYFKTYYFKNVLYPYFFKRRDDPWGRIWSGYLALKDDDDYVYRTNTLHGYIPYNVLYNNNDNTVSNNELIIPPGWVWQYKDRTTVTPITKTSSEKIETAKTLVKFNEDDFIFVNPFGIRIQKEPFAIGYFNPWINQYLTTTNTGFVNTNPVDNTDQSILYHATTVFSEIQRLYKSNYYNLTTYILPSIENWGNANETMVQYLKRNATEPAFTSQIWNYFNMPLDMYTPHIPLLALSEDEDGYLPFDKQKTFFCVQSKDRIDNDTWRLKNIWIDDYSTAENKRIFIPITGNITGLVGSNKIWGDDGICKDYNVYASGVTDINIYADVDLADKQIQFGRVQSQNYYRLDLMEDAENGVIDKIIVGNATLIEEAGFGENQLYRIGNKYDNIFLNVHFADGSFTTITISNAAAVYSPYECILNADNMYEIDMSNVYGGGIIVYAEMKPSPESGSVEYYRVPFSVIEKETPFFWIDNKLLPTDLNNMRAVLTAYVAGNAVGYVEMQPVTKEEDGSYKFEVQMHPLNELVDIDDRIRIASTGVGGGSWKSLNSESAGVSINATKPDLKISILIRSETPNYPSEIYGDESFKQFRIVDEYKIDDFDLVQELKEMRSVVEFGDSSNATKEQHEAYNSFIELYNSSSAANDIYSLFKYSSNRANGMMDNIGMTYDAVIETAIDMYNKFNKALVTYTEQISPNIPDELDKIKSALSTISFSTAPGNNIDWDEMTRTFISYVSDVNNAFASVNINNGMTIQLMPFTEHSLILDDRFENFVRSFVNVHKAIEPVIFNRLDGNHYLDCKLIATYGLPHTYCTDNEKIKNLPIEQTLFWPDLSIQISFDVRFKNPSLSSNTTDELKLIVKSYFNKLTTLHTSKDRVNMNNNIYISRLIHEMSNHDNVEYLKFNGFYTDDKGSIKGKYMDANIQAIVQRWDTLEDFPKYSSNGKMISELENFVPEMFILDENNIIINSI